LRAARDDGSKDDDLPAGTDGFEDPGNRDRPVLLRGKYRFQVPTVGQAHTALKKLNQLTPRQQEVIAMYAEGLTASEIADRLKISTQRVADIRQDAMMRLGAKTVVGLIGAVTRLSIEASFAFEVA
jgi:DNA-binding CsgD family transcriptional regulator